MRIIAGAAKGRRLQGPGGRHTRPMTDRAREAIFSSLGPAVVEARVLDLYAGTGSLGLEALSRGATDAVFVEWRRSVAQVLRRNIDRVGLGGRVVAAKVEDHLARDQDRYGIAFVDPPYDTPLADVADVLTRLGDRLDPGGIVVVHRRAGSGEIEVVPMLVVVDRRRYGDAEITRLVREAQA